MQPYQPGKYVMVRTPILPLSDLPRGTPEQTRRILRTLLTRPEIQEAILIASPSLYKALPRYLETEVNTLDQRQRHQIEVGALKYVLRAITRPTPYGTFCGVSVADVTNSFSIDIAPTSHHRTVSQLDFSQALAVAFKCEELLTEEHNPRIYSHPAILRFGERFFIENVTRRGEGDSRSASIRATAAAEGIISLCARGQKLQVLLRWLSDQYPHRTISQNFLAVRHLIEAGFLFTDLRPSPMCSDPLNHLLDRTESIPAFDTQYAQLHNLQGLLAEADRSSLGEGLDYYQRIGRAGTFTSQVDNTDAPNSDTGAQAPRRVDLITHLVKSEFSNQVAEEAAGVYAVLVRLAGQEYKHPLKTYLERFRERYGERLVPILELLSPVVGLGPVDGYARPAPANQSQAMNLVFNVKDQFLFDLALSSQGAEEIQLKDHESELLSFEKALAEQDMPASGEIYIRILSNSQEDIQVGEYRLVLGPIGATSMAGKTFGRFAKALPPEAYEQFQRQTSPPDVRYANSSYFPTTSRLMNVNAQYKSEEWEIPFGVPPLDDENVILPSEILVGANESGFFLVSAVDNSRIIVNSNHMLSLYLAPNIIRFLEEVSRQQQNFPMPFSWGQGANLLRYFPRVVYGRTILKPRTWRLDRKTFQIPDKQDENVILAHLEKIRQIHDLPQRIEIGHEDALLTLDLDNALHAAILIDEARKAEGEHILIQESFAESDLLWPNAGGESHLLEFVIPVFQTSPSPVLVPRSIHTEASWSERVFPVGSEWIYLRLYAGFTDLQELLRLHIAPILNVLKPTIDCMFYIFYHDTKNHIRLRILPTADKHESVLSQLLSMCAELKRNGLISQAILTDYEKELERYGGIHLMRHSEDAFYTSSHIALSYLDEHYRQDDSFAMTFTAWTNLLLLSRIFDKDALRHFISEIAMNNNDFVVGRMSSKQRYSEVKHLRNMLMDGGVSTPPCELSETLNSSLFTYLTQHHKVFLLASTHLDSKRFTSFIASHLHMHANRMGLNRVQEALVYQGMHNVVSAMVHTGGFETFQATTPFATVLDDSP